MMNKLTNSVVQNAVVKEHHVDVNMIYVNVGRTDVLMVKDNVTTTKNANVERIARY
jgi:hypothetical protein